MTLRAGTLYIVIVLAVVISLLSTSLFLVYYFKNVAITRQKIKEKLVLNINSAKQWVLARPDIPPEEVVDLFGQAQDSVRITYTLHGIFEVVSLQAYKGKDTLTSTFMIGYKADNLMQSAIYLCDQNRPLSLCGTTKLKGTCYMPEAGMKRAYIEGQSYLATSLVEGDTKRSTSQLPKLDPNIRKNILKMLESINEPMPPTGEDYQQQFTQEKLSFFSASSIYLSQQMKGNILIKSNKEIVVSSQSQLTDVILVAPIVRFEKGFKGCVQVFATDSITLEEDCQLAYPSALALIKMKFREGQPNIQVKSGSVIRGICYADVEVEDRTQVRFSLEPKATLIGQAYVNGFAEIKGTIFGHLSCQKFILNTQSSIYENHLLNATIDYTKLSKRYIGSSLFNSDKSRKVVKYL